uniref:Heparanase 2 (inactive) n=1 Tax=Monodelphis domestica TaxID=13616 RepID=K7E5C8_MONDO
MWTPIFMDQERGHPNSKREYLILRVDEDGREGRKEGRKQASKQQAYHGDILSTGDRRTFPVGKSQGVKEKTLILLDVSTKSPVRTVNENFLSLQLDPSIIHDGWLDFLSSKRLVTLARGLSPAFLRFGGKRTDFLQFQNLRNPAKSRGGPGPDYYLKNYEDDPAQILYQYLCQESKRGHEESDVTKTTTPCLLVEE